MILDNTHRICGGGHSLTNPDYAFLMDGDM